MARQKIVKTSEDGIVEGIPFYHQRQRRGGSVVTGADGMVSLDLLPGTYLVTEQPIDRYVTPASQYITIEAADASVSFQHLKSSGGRPQGGRGNRQAGDASLAGPSMACKGGELVDTFTTGPDGSFVTGWLSLRG